MPKIHLNSKGEWEEVSEREEGFYLDGYLKEKLDNVLKIQSKGWDAVLLIDGKERSGKSTLAMTCAWYLSKGKITINNFAKGIEEAKQKILTLPDGSWLFIDEGSLVFNSKESINRVNLELQKIMDVVGQKNMIFIVVLPSFFDLAKPIATRRSLFLLHVYVDEDWQRGYFSYYGMNKKEKLYVEGKKNYNKYVVTPELHGKFSKFETPFHEEYLTLKENTLNETLNHNKKDNKDEVWLLKYIIFLLMKSTPIKTQAQVSRIVKRPVRVIHSWGDYGGRVRYDDVGGSNL